MNVFMLKNSDGDYYQAYSRNKRKQWVQDQRKGSIWTSRNGPIQSLKKNHFKDCTIVEYELVELKNEDILNH